MAILACLLSSPALGLAAPITVRFELNDAQVKDKPLPAVRVSVSAPGAAKVEAATGADGRCAVRVEPGVYEVSYSLDGYVPYTSSTTELREDGQLVTVSLSRMLEATESNAGEVRIILNWGSREDQVRDADAHLSCGCRQDGRHVYFGRRRHHDRVGGHSAALDVDDTDYGGPETITISNPPQGSYVYWVHSFSGPPPRLGASDVVVRVVTGSQQAGEFRVPPGLTRRAWRPFKSIEVDAHGRPQLVRWTEDEIAAGADLDVPADMQPASSLSNEPDRTAPVIAAVAGVLCVLIALAVVAVPIVGLVVWSRRRKRAAR